jgi:hypothetical protein
MVTSPENWHKFAMFRIAEIRKKLGVRAVDLA